MYFLISSFDGALLPSTDVSEEFESSVSRGDNWHGDFFRGLCFLPIPLVSRNTQHNHLGLQ